MISIFLTFFLDMLEILWSYILGTMESEICIAKHC